MVAHVLCDCSRGGWFLMLWQIRELSRVESFVFFRDRRYSVAVGCSGFARAVEGFEFEYY